MWKKKQNSIYFVDVRMFGDHLIIQVISFFRLLVVKKWISIDVYALSTCVKSKCEHGELNCDIVKSKCENINWIVNMLNMLNLFVEVVKLYDYMFIIYADVLN